MYIKQHCDCFNCLVLFNPHNYHPARYSFCLYSKKKKKKATNGNSLANQWLGLCTFINEGSGSIPSWGTKILQIAQCGQIFLN